MVDQLVLDLVLGDPIVEMGIARANGNIQVPFVGPIVHLQHRVSPEGLQYSG
jgi:hypothetical protein